ncbi:MAG: YbaN family protein [Salinibacterium sp.]|nr:YbaN family protein [Salinibacterium sp.]
MTQLRAIPTLPERPPISSRRAIRWAWAAFGMLCVGLGAVGAVVPGLPTTVFLMIACWAFAKSCPALERWVLNTRLFAPYAKYLDGTTPMPLKAKLIAIGLMWVSVAASGLILMSSESAPAWVVGVIIVAATVGTVFIARWQPRAARAAVVSGQ